MKNLTARHASILVIALGCALTATATQAQGPAAAAKPAKAAPQVKSKHSLLFDDCVKRAKYTAASFYCATIADLLAPQDDSDVQFSSNTLGTPALQGLAFGQAVALIRTKAIVAEAVVDNLAQLQAGRVDKQLGSPTSANGSTNLVSKPGATQLLDLAVESGALSQTQNGNTLTVEANLDHLVRDAAGTPLPGYFLHGTSPVDRIFDPITVSASFLTNTSGTTSVPVSGSATSSAVDVSSVTSPSSVTKLSSVTARYQLWNKFDPKDAKFSQAYRQAVKEKSVAFSVEAGAVSNLAKAALNGCQASDFVKTAGLGSSNAAAVIAQFNQCFERRLNGIENSPGAAAFDQAVDTLNTKIAADIVNYRNSIQTAQGPPALTFEYTYNRPQSQPETHDFRLVSSGNFGVGLWTLNAAGSIYGGTIPATAKYGRFKDAQFSGEFDRKIVAGASDTSPSWSIAAYGQWQSDPSVLNIDATSVPAGITLPDNAQVLLKGTQGWLGVAQGKIIFKVGGAQIPLAVKWSNKTSLLDKSKLGAQFGINYDLSQFKQLLGGS